MNVSDQPKSTNGGKVMLLEGKRILVTGVATKQSIAFAIAERAQRAGAEVLLSSFGRARRLTERAARGLCPPVEVLELDATSPEDHQRLAAELERRWGGLDGVVHSVAFAPPDALGGNFLATSSASAETAFRVSAYSLKELAASLWPLLSRDGGGAIVGLDFDATVAWPAYDWMGVSKAALEAVSRYLARDLGAHDVRVNLIAAGPLHTVAASGVPGFAELSAHWEAQAPLRWDPRDAGPVADAACFLLSPWARAITGELLHVDGGFHAMGAPLAPASRAEFSREPASVDGRISAAAPPLLALSAAE
jgi:enoyl ACP reductase